MVTNFHFVQDFPRILKKDIYKCPKQDFQNTFGKIILHHKKSLTNCNYFFTPLWVGQ